MASNIHDLTLNPNRATVELVTEDGFTITFVGIKGSAAYDLYNYLKAGIDTHQIFDVEVNDDRSF